MPRCDTLIRNAHLMDGSGHESHAGSGRHLADVALSDGRIAEISASIPWEAVRTIDAKGLTLAPGFIDTHTHDDTSVIRTPQMLPKLSQGVTTVVVGNCGISAAPADFTGTPPDPMNLLGGPGSFCYPSFESYVKAIGNAQPAVNIAAFVGHTTLRNNHMDRLDREATEPEIGAMRAQLVDALGHGAFGLSTGLAYLSACAASTKEVLALAEPLAAFGAYYVTHLRSESDSIRDALEEAFLIGRQTGVPVIISHLKCAGIANWGRSAEVLRMLEQAQSRQEVGFDCYPYAAGSSTLDLRQVDARVKITITWSEKYPEVAGQTLAEISSNWEIDQLEAAGRLQPAGAIYHSIAEADMQRILAHPQTMIGSDGLPHDPHPHPRLWGTFPRVLGRYCREEKLFSLEQAIHKMTGLPARRFGLRDRGLIQRGYAADLVLFNPETVSDAATFADPIAKAEGIAAVWVNGVLSFHEGGSTGQRAGHFLAHSADRQVRSKTQTVYSHS
jgi:N-acyl-D-amino-acid deacylase